MPAKGGKDDRHYGILLTSTMTSQKDPGQLLRSAVAKRRQGARVTVFLLGDGVLLATNPRFTDLAEAIAAGVRVLVSKDHLEATGLSKDRLVKGAILVERSYRDLVTMTMEEWDRVIVC